MGHHVWQKALQGDCTVTRRQPTFPPSIVSAAPATHLHDADKQVGEVESRSAKKNIWVSTFLAFLVSSGSLSLLLLLLLSLLLLLLAGLGASPASAVPTVAGFCS